MAMTSLACSAHARIEECLNVGNDKESLIAVVTQLLPYIGYPRALSALTCVNDVIPEAQR